MRRRDRRRSWRRSDGRARRRSDARRRRALRTTTKEQKIEAEDDDEIDSDATDDEDAFDWRAVRANGDGNDGDDGARASRADARGRRRDDDVGRRESRRESRRDATQPWRARLPNFTPARELPPQSFHDGELVFVDYEAQFGGTAERGVARVREARGDGGRAAASRETARRRRRRRRRPRAGSRTRAVAKRSSTRADDRSWAKPRTPRPKGFARDPARVVCRRYNSIPKPRSTRSP